MFDLGGVAAQNFPSDKKNDKKIHAIFSAV